MSTPTPTDAATPFKLKLPLRVAGKDHRGNTDIKDNEDNVVLVIEEWNEPNSMNGWTNVPKRGYDHADEVVRAVNEYDALCKVSEACEKVLRQCESAQSESAGHKASLYAVDKLTNALAELTAIRNQKSV